MIFGTQNLLISCQKCKFCSNVYNNCGTDGWFPAVYSDVSQWCTESLPFALQVLLNQKEISGEEIDFILDSYPPHTPINLILEEGDPGSLPFFSQKQKQDTELEYSLLSS